MKHRNIYVTYLLVIILGISISHCWGVLTITVGPGSSDDFHDLQSAIDSLADYTGTDTEAIIKLADSTYENPSPYVINCGLMHVMKLTIESAYGPGNCILHGTYQTSDQGLGTVFHVSGSPEKQIFIKNLSMISTIDDHPLYYQTATLQELRFEGCYLNYKKQAIEIENGWGESTINILNNHFTDILPIDSNQNKGGINITGEYEMDIAILNNEFIDLFIPIFISAYHHNTLISHNKFVAPQNSSTSTVLQIDDLENNPDSYMEISENEFINTGIDTDRVPGEIRGNVFFNSNPNHSSWIRCLDWNNNSITQLAINENIFYGTGVSTCVHAETHNNLHGSVHLSMKNNSFINVASAVQIDIDDDTTQNHISSFRNNLLQCTSNPMILNNLGTGNPDNPVSIDHCLFVNGYPADSSYFVVDTPSCPIEDPLINMDIENHTYTLIWNNEARSPLIMAGYGNEGLGSPYHANRLDIGAVQYSEHPHEFVTYTFPPYSERNGLKWMSFPTLDRIWNPATNEPDVAGFFFYPIINPDVLSSISWKIYNTDPQTFHYDDITEQWLGDLGHEIVPQQGYKIQMAHSLEVQEQIAERGLIPQVAQYPLTIKAQSASKATDIDNENWLGYFNQNTTHVCDAFTGIIDNLWFIQTQNWTMVRQKKEPGSPWIMDYQWGKEPTLSYGDMVIVKCFTDDQFFWNTAAPSQDPVEKELPQYYVYEEKPDYVPLYVELDSNNLPKEIALYVDDVCKGAAVVSDSLVEIPAYILDGVDPNSIVELRCIYNDKASVDQIPAYRVWNPESNSYENKTLTINRKNYYYMLKLEQNGNNSPILPDTAISVYPNPFNPNTTIRFCLPEASKIKLEIYNQKGQLVKSLAQGNADSGWHSKVWNGTDSHNRKVASGLYYSKLSYNGKSIMKKMVLLK